MIQIPRVYIVHEEGEFFVRIGFDEPFKPHPFWGPFHQPEMTTTPFDNVVCDAPIENIDGHDDETNRLGLRLLFTLDDMTRVSMGTSQSPMRTFVQRVAQTAFELGRQHGKKEALSD